MPTLSFRIRSASIAAMLAGVLCLGASAAAAAEDARRYAECIALAQRKPTDGWETALAWSSLGGGEAARHCAAVALIGLGHLEEAATRLERLAQESRREAALRAEMLGQAAQAWLLAGQRERAIGTLDAALKLAPDAVDLLVDRALAQAEGGDYRAALADLDHAVKAAPRRADVLALRAAAKRRLGDAAGAEEDVMSALEIEPDQPDALIESGILQLQRGDVAAARRDWRRVLELQPDGPAADAARRHIETLDAGISKR
jgi:tetratricopeptide (TPR) repeat protein